MRQPARKTKANKKRPMLREERGELATCVAGRLAIRIHYLLSINGCLCFYIDKNAVVQRIAGSA